MQYESQFIAAVTAAWHAAYNEKPKPKPEEAASGSASTTEQPKEAAAGAIAGNQWEVTPPPQRTDLVNPHLARVPVRPRCIQCSMLLHNDVCVEPECSRFMTKPADGVGQPKPADAKPEAKPADAEPNAKPADADAKPPEAEPNAKPAEADAKPPEAEPAEQDGQPMKAKQTRKGKGNGKGKGGKKLFPKDAGAKGTRTKMSRMSTVRTIDYPEGQGPAGEPKANTGSGAAASSGTTETAPIVVGGSGSRPSDQTVTEEPSDSGPQESVTMFTAEQMKACLAQAHAGVKVEDIKIPPRPQLIIETRDVFVKKLPDAVYKEK